MASSLVAEECAAGGPRSPAAFEYSRTSAIDLNLDTLTFKPFQDRRVRQALNHAIDKTAIVRNTLGGHGKPLATSVVPEAFGFNPELRPYAFDPERARRLLAEAGYANGFDVGYDTTIGRYPQDKEIAEVVAGQLAKVGVRVAVKGLEWGAFYDGVKAKKRAPIHNIGMSTELFDADNTFSLHFKAGTIWSRWNHPEFDRLVQVARTTLDQPMRKWTATVAIVVCQGLLFQSAVIASLGAPYRGEGCVEAGVLYSLHAGKKQYRLTLSEPFDLRPYEGKKVLLEGEIYPGDSFKPRDRALKVLGPCAGGAGGAAAPARPAPPPARPAAPTSGSAAGEQIRGRPGKDAELRGGTFSIPQGMVGTIVSVRCDGDGFWIEGPSGGRFNSPSAAVGRTLLPGRYAIFPNLKPKQDRAGVSVTFTYTKAR